MGSLSFFIARRYLFAKKSHNAINIISLVSAVGVALGSFALVVVLSVYNGLDQLITSLHNTVASDLKITAVEGKVFDPQGAPFDAVPRLAGVAACSEALEENALLKYGGYQHLATVRGVDEAFLRHSGLSRSVVEGEATVKKGDVNMAIVGRVVAETLKLRPSFTELLWLYFPKRGLRPQGLDPQGALNRDYLTPAGVFSIELTTDAKYVFAPLAVVQRLLGYEREVSSVELYLHPKAQAKRVKREVQALLGSGFKVQTREEQNEVLYRMMQGEKWAIFFILSFVLLVASFNSVGSLTMLIIEKQRDVKVLRSLGAPGRLVRRIFTIEGTMISLLGCAAGVALGLITCGAQAYFKLIKLAGNFVIDTYPVRVEGGDIALVAATVVAIGYAAASLPVRYLITNDNTQR
ncbi:MAG: ABC transporter permease [Prevotellaceae bacterium]|jgi:ABC-type lipoprotein release transport system permease subunit|nr:ABC transporter permease [Prevotellaceae bacterium]